MILPYSWVTKAAGTLVTFKESVLVSAVGANVVIRSLVSSKQ
jgi:hypothetical protein